MGFEPTTFGTTIRDSNQLSYIHRMFAGANIQQFSIIQTKIDKNNLFSSILS